MKTYIPLENHPRQSHFAYFNSLAFPYVALTAETDVTNAVRWAKARGASGFHVILWAASRAVNQIPELRQRIEGDKIVQYDHCLTGHTVALPDRTFCNCTTDCRYPLEEFLIHARARQEEAKLHPGFVNDAEEEYAMIFSSCMPWVSFTQVIQPVPIPGDCNPRLVFGKYIHRDQRVYMPLAIQCNHALVDGWHIGEFYRIFQEIVDSLA